MARCYPHVTSESGCQVQNDGSLHSTLVKEKTDQFSLCGSQEITRRRQDDRYRKTKHIDSPEGRKQLIIGISLLNASKVNHHREGGVIQ